MFTKMASLVLADKSTVQKFCKDNELTDWTQLSQVEDKPISLSDAKQLYNVMKLVKEDVPFAQFFTGLNVELEHGLAKKGVNITGNHPLLTAAIALAHIKESKEYYTHLEDMEEQFD